MVMVDCDPENGGMAINPEFRCGFWQRAERAKPVPRSALSGRRLHKRYLAMKIDHHWPTVRQCSLCRFGSRKPLLDELRDQGVDLPYGCKYGGCITCAAKLPMAA